MALGGEGMCALRTKPDKPPPIDLDIWLTPIEDVGVAAVLGCGGDLPLAFEL